MTLRKSRFVPWVLGLVVIGAVAFAAACSGQGEGERCSTLSDNNGNDDCAGSLVCTPGGQINGGGADRCCPADRTQATTAVCAVQTAVGINPGGPEAGVTDTGTSETGADAAKDSATTDTGAGDAGSDAPADG